MGVIVPGRFLLGARIFLVGWFCAILIAKRKYSDSADRVRSYAVDLFCHELHEFHELRGTRSVSIREIRG
jgi:hypothetical protein